MKRITLAQQARIEGGEPRIVEGIGVVVGRAAEQCEETFAHV